MPVFCTLFDSNYLSRGLAMYYSLEKHCRDFRLYIFSFDDICSEILKRLDLKNVTIITLQEFEDTELLKVKPTRTRGEYCWTCTSSTILYVLENFSPESCTYIDADMIFYSDPKILLDELGEKSILITEHAYSNIYKLLERNGIYCVQFVCFKNDERGLLALNWWRNACIEWCYARIEDGKFGDQRYLDDWTERFEGVHVMKNKGGGAAPWNIRDYEIEDVNDNLILIEKKTGMKYQLIFYHFHDLKIFANRKIQLSGAVFEINEKVRQLIYIPYFKKLSEAGEKIKQVNLSVNFHGIRQSEIHSEKLFKKIISIFSEIIKNYIFEFFKPGFWYNSMKMFMIIRKGKSNVVDNDYGL